MSKQKKFSQIVEDFLQFIQDKNLIIHNAEFDLAHLNNELLLNGKKKIENKVIDTLELARTKYPGSSSSLDALCKRFRIDNSRRAKHTALIDCDLLAKVYINLIDQKAATHDFRSEEKNEISRTDGTISYFKKIIQPSNEEIGKHKEYLKNSLKKNFY